MGFLPPGLYEFYYTFTKAGCTATDTLQIEVYAPNVTVNAGNDTIFCMGNNDLEPQAEWGTARTYFLNGIPNIDTVLAYDFTVWWEIVGDTIPVSTSPTRHVFIPDAQDTITFVYHVIDACGNSEYTDTVVVQMNDIDLPESSNANPYAIVCPEDTGIVHQLTLFGYEVLPDDPSLTFNWHQVSGTAGGIIIIDGTLSDSVQFIGNITGLYEIRAQVTDSDNGCVFYDDIWVSVRDTPNIDAGPDILVCNGNNDNTTVPSTNVSRAVSMNAISPSMAEIDSFGYGTWWSMIRDDGTEWVFPNCIVPFDGGNEGDVYTGGIIIPGDCPNLGFNALATMPHMPGAIYNFRNAQDTVVFIWHVLNPCNNETLTDTMVVYMNDIDLPVSNSTYPLATVCVGESDTLSQIVSPNFRELLDDASLSFSWTIESGPTSGISFTNSTLSNHVEFTGCTNRIVQNTGYSI